MDQTRLYLMSSRIHACLRNGAMVLVLICAAGCSDSSSPGWYENLARINHYHNDANQKTAEDALGRFGEFTTGTTSLASLLQKNLDARHALETTVSEARSRVFDTELSRLTTNVSWYQLRAHLLSSLGMLADEPTIAGEAISATNAPIDVSDPNQIPRLPAILAKYDPEFARKIAQRQTRLATAVKILRLKAVEAWLPHQSNSGHQPIRSRGK